MGQASPPHTPPPAAMTVAADRQCHAQAIFSPATGGPAPSKHYLLLRSVARQRCRWQPVQATAGFEQSRGTALLLGGVLLGRSPFRAASIASDGHSALDLPGLFCFRLACTFSLSSWADGAGPI